MKTKPDIEALHQLIRVLHEVEARPPEVFDMDHYKERRGCGFSACAYGHALSDPWFTQRYPIEWETHKFNGDVLVPLFDGKYDAIVYHGSSICMQPGRDIVFGLDRTQFNLLFMPGSYDDEDEPDKYEDGIRPHHVIERVEQLLAELAAAIQEKDNG